MRNYVNKCATCKSFKKKKRKRAGICTNKNARYSNEVYGLINMSKMKCTFYNFDVTRLCKCGTFKEENHEYCPTCGRKLEGD